MPKKIVEGAEVPLEELDTSWESGVSTPLEKKVEELTPAPEQPKESSKGKTKATVHLILKDTLLVVDEKGSGLIIPITEKNKNVKIGDTVLL